MLASRLSIVLGVIFMGKTSGVDGEAGTRVLSGGDGAGSGLGFL